MIIHRISIDQFGVLSGMSLPNVSRGLAVIHGANGSGKTTLLHFLRGMFCGFNQSRRLKLLSLSNEGRAQGTVGLQLGENQLEVVRQERRGRSDRLAISLLQGEIAGLRHLRTRFDAVNVERFTTVFAPSSDVSHDLTALLRVAVQDGMELRTVRRQEDWLSERIEQVRRERAELFEGDPPGGRVAELERRRADALQEFDRLLQRQQTQQCEHQAAVAALQRELQDVQQEVDRLHAELAATQSDLSDLNDRLWSVDSTPVRKNSDQERAASAHPSLPNGEAEQIDSRIARSRAVLADLAVSRMELSKKIARLTGTDVPNARTSPIRQRELIDSITSELNRLTAEWTSGTSREAVSVPDTLSVRDTLTLRLELSLLQDVQELAALRSERDGIDRCEMELVREIERLRRSRLERNGPSEIRNEPQQDHCMFQGPAAADARNNADDRRRGRTLRARRDQLRQEWWEGLSKQRDVFRRLRGLEAGGTVLAQDKLLEERRRECASLEQQLADAREQWQSLTLLQRVLQRTDQKLRSEQPSDVVEEASAWLRRTTCGRYAGFRSDGEDLSVVDGAGAEVPVDALSRGTLDQVVLSFRMALCAEYARRGIEFPLVLDDVLADSDEERLRSSVAALIDFAHEGRQVLFFTCQDHLADLFESLGVPVHSLSGRASPHPVDRVESPGHPGPAMVPPHVEPPVDVPLSQPANEECTRPPEFRRIQPTSPYWLELNSPLSLVPSISSQMAGRLGALGVRDVGDLIDLDPLTTEVPLDGVQIPASLLRVWQAEGRLLALVPNLTGRDAQLIVAAGCLGPSQLAEIGADELLHRVARVRRERNGGPEIDWLAEFLPGPDRETVLRWISSAGHVRSYAQARQTADRRRPDGLTEHRRLRRRQRRQQRTAGANGPARHAG